MHFLLLFFFILFAATLGGLDFFLRFPPRDVARFPQAKRGLEWATFGWNERPEMDGPCTGSRFVSADSRDGCPCVGRGDPNFEHSAKSLPLRLPKGRRVAHCRLNLCLDDGS